jgi:hypothetical protein
MTSMKCFRRGCKYSFAVAEFNAQRKVINCPCCGMPNDAVKAVHRAKPDYMEPNEKEDS